MNDMKTCSSDVQRAIELIGNHSVAFCKGDAVAVYDGKGVSPLLRAIDDNVNFSGYSACDKIVGKAAASLFVLLGAVSVHGKVMSKHGLEYLQNHGIKASYEILCDDIINRDGTGVCPMEKAVKSVEEPSECLIAISQRLSELRKEK